MTISDLGVAIKAQLDPSFSPRQKRLSRQRSRHAIGKGATIMVKAAMAPPCGTSDGPVGKMPVVGGD
jgi:hypothetical protein